MSFKLHFSKHFYLEKENSDQSVCGEGVARTQMDDLIISIGAETEP